MCSWEICDISEATLETLLGDSLSLRVERTTSYRISFEIVANIFLGYFRILTIKPYTSTH